MTLLEQEMRVEYLAGLVLSIDPANRLLSVEEASLAAENRTLSVPADARVHKRGRAIELRAIRIGEPVSIEYENSPTGPVAQTVKVITKPGSASAERSA